MSTQLYIELRNYFLLFFFLSVFLPFFYKSYAYSQEITFPQLSKGVDSNSVGCIFPLSGKYELLGKKALKGTLTATGFFEFKTRDVRVIVKDSGDASERPEELLNDIVKVDHVSVLIGPILSDYLKELDGIINLLEIPTVVFPLSAEDTSDSNPYLIEFSYSLENQAHVLARYAASDIKINSFGVLYPQTRIGEVFKDAFIKSVREFGGNVIYVGSYDPKLVDISTEVRWIKLRNPNAIFIPDSATNSAELIKKLGQERGLKGLIFLGPSTWNSDTFLNAVGNEANKIVLTDFFFPGSSRWIDFREKYRATFKEEPGFLEFQVYEAVNLILHILQFPVRDRKEVIERLLALRDSPLFDIRQGQGGGLEISPKPLVLIVRNGAIVKVK
ncbi:MAG TPA: penicillin-binding protein activator [Thermodesulfobacteriota bacterium]|nr:penicillin-binding protein activator [Thermodesulfobacteriota bacterium]